VPALCGDSRFLATLAAWPFLCAAAVEMSFETPVRHYGVSAIHDKLKPLENCLSGCGCDRATMVTDLPDLRNDLTCE
jgi:hypothetical protein